jgi:hypothetical protein
VTLWRQKKKEKKRKGPFGGTINFFFKIIEFLFIGGKQKVGMGPQPLGSEASTLP